MPRPDLDRAINIPIVGDYKPLARDLKASKGLIGKFGVAAAAGFAAAAAAAAGFGVAVGKSVITVDNMRSTIGRVTGAAGKDLDALTERAIQLQGRVTQADDVIATAFGNVQKSFKGTNEEVDALTTRFLRLSDVTGSDLDENILLAARASGVFGSEAADTAKNLDVVLATAQRYPIEVGKIFELMGDDWAPLLQQLNLTIGEGTVLLGRWAASGIELQKSIPMIERFTEEAIEAGKDPAAAFDELEASLKNAGSELEAERIAINALGGDGHLVAQAIRSGALSFQDLAKEAAGATGSVSAVWEETLTLQDRWKLFTGSLSRELNERVFPHLGTFVGWMQSAVGQVDKLDEWLDRMSSGPMADIAEWVRSVWPKIVSEGRNIWYIARNIAAVLWDLVDGPLKSISRFISGQWERFAATMTNLREDVSKVGSSIGRLTSGKLAEFIGKLGDVENWIDTTWAGWFGDWGTLDSDDGPIAGVSGRLSNIPTAELSVDTSGITEEDTQKIGGLSGFLHGLAASVERLTGLEATEVLVGAAAGLGALTFRAAPSLMNPVGLAIAGVAAAIGGIVLLYNNNPGFKQWLDELWDGISQTAIDLWNSMGEAWDTLNNIWNTTVEFFKGDTDLREFITGLKDAIDGFSLLDIPKLITTPLWGFADVIGSMNDRLSRAVKDDDLGKLTQALSGSGLLLGGVWEGLTGLAQYLAGSFLGDVNLAEDGLQHLADGLDAIKDALLGLPNAIELALDFIVKVTLPSWWNVLTFPWKLTWKLLNWAFDAAGTGISAIRNFVEGTTPLERDMLGLTPAVGARQIPVSATSRQTQSWQGLPSASGYPPSATDGLSQFSGGGPMFGGQTGAIVTRPTMSWVGETGPEAVIPLSSAPGASPLPTGGNMTIVIEVDGRELGRSVINSLNDVARKSSSTLQPLRAALANR